MIFCILEGAFAHLAPVHAPARKLQPFQVSKHASGAQRRLQEQPFAGKESHKKSTPEDITSLIQVSCVASCR